MKSLNFKKIISVLNIFAIVFLMTVPVFVLAQGPLIENDKPVNFYTITYFMQSLVRIVEFIFKLVAIISVIFIVYAGWLYMSSAGDAGKVKQAHKILQNIVIGFFIAAAAWLIVQAIVNTLGVESPYKPGGF